MPGGTYGKLTNWEIGDLGDLKDWKVRESGRFGRLGNSGVWEIREIRKNYYMGQKKTLENPVRSGKFGDWVIRELGGYGRNGSLRSFGNFECSGKTLVADELRNLGKGIFVSLEFREIGEFRRFGRLVDSGQCGNSRM